MLRYALALALGASIVAVSAYSVTAEDKKKDEKGTEQKITGTVTCAKCDLKETKTCMTVVKEGDKVYYFDADSSKKYHKNVCQTPTDGTVVGTVKKQGDKNVVTVKSV